MPRRKRANQPTGKVDRLLDRDPDEEINLHGHTAEQAATRLRNQLTTWSRSRSGITVHIITGKGRGSPGKPVLKPRVLGLIKGELFHLIRDWARHENDGGYIVELR